MGRLDCRTRRDLTRRARVFEGGAWGNRAGVRLLSCGGVVFNHLDSRIGRRNGRMPIPSFVFPRSWRPRQELLAEGGGRLTRGAFCTALRGRARRVPPPINASSSCATRRSYKGGERQSQPALVGVSRDAFVANRSRTVIVSGARAWFSGCRVFRSKPDESGRRAKSRRAGRNAGSRLSASTHPTPNCARGDDREPVGRGDGASLSSVRDGRSRSHTTEAVLRPTRDHRAAPPSAAAAPLAHQWPST